MTFLLLSSCMAYPPTEPIAFEPDDTRVTTLAMVRPTWDGTRPDAFCQPDIGNDILWQLKNSLQSRGYLIVNMPTPPLDNSNRPDILATMAGETLARSAPESSDAVFRLRIVEYLDASLCDGGYEIKSLDITAIAEIYARPDGKKIWETRQLCSDLSTRTSDTVYACSVQLSQRIAARLPPATH